MASLAKTTKNKRRVKLEKKAKRRTAKHRRLLTKLAREGKVLL